MAEYVVYARAEVVYCCEVTADSEGDAAIIAATSTKLAWRRKDDQTIIIDTMNVSVSDAPSTNKPKEQP